MTDTKVCVRVCQTCAAAIGGLLSELYGEWDGLIIALICCIVADYITGVIAASVTKTLSSGVGFRGLAKKFLILILVAAACVLDRYVLSTNGTIRSMVTVFYISNEAISILENCGRAGVPVPAKLKQLFEQLKEKKEEE
jgi:toxin secretion/phage lysis holin